MEDGVHIGFSQSVEARIEVGDVGLGTQPDGIHARAEMPQAAVGLDQAHDRDLLGHRGLALASPVQTRPRPLFAVVKKPTNLVR